MCFSLKKYIFVSKLKILTLNDDAATILHNVYNLFCYDSNLREVLSFFFFYWIWQFWILQDILLNPLQDQKESIFSHQKIVPTFFFFEKESHLGFGQLQPLFSASNPYPHFCKKFDISWLLLLYSHGLGTFYLHQCFFWKKSDPTRVGWAQNIKNSTIPPRRPIQKR